MAVRRTLGTATIATPPWLTASDAALRLERGRARSKTRNPSVRNRKTVQQAVREAATI